MLKKRGVKIIEYSIMASVGVFITPYLVMIAGIILLFAGFFSSSVMFRLLGNKTLVKNGEIKDIEDPDKIYEFSWKKALFRIIIGVILIALSMIFLVVGWKGIIYYL